MSSKNKLRNIKTKYVNSDAYIDEIRIHKNDIRLQQTKKIQIEIDASLIRASKIRAVENGTTFASIVEHALRDYFND